MTLIQTIYVMIAIGILGFVGGLYTQQSLNDWNERNKQNKK